MSVRKLLHTNTDIFFGKPYMVRIDYDPTTTEDVALRDYQKLMRQTSRVIHGTWGYSNLEQVVSFDKENQSQFQVSNIPVFGIDIVYRGYVCFKDEIDATRFRLSLSQNSRHIFMWPSKLKFTIHEFIEDDS